jgi:hypothetical protein
MADSWGVRSSHSAIGVGATAVGSGGEVGWEAVVGVGMRFKVGGGTTVGVEVGSTVGVGLAPQPATRRSRIINRVMSFLSVMVIFIISVCDVSTRWRKCSIG